MESSSVDAVAAIGVIQHHKSPLLLSLTLQEEDTDDSNIDKAACTAMIILNAPIQKPVSPLFQRLWNGSTYHVCADGGANRLMYATTSNNECIDDDDDRVYNKMIPDVITGDLDSLLPATRLYYEHRGAEIVEVADQDSNDLDKALAAVVRHYAPNKQPRKTDTIRCVVFGAFGGRFDQEMAGVQALYKYSNSNLQLFLYDDHTMAFLLPSGCVNHIHLALASAANADDDDDDGVANGPSVVVSSEGPTCGLIPLGSPVERVTTTGLQWNLQNQKTAFGDLVSTSNRILQLDDAGGGSVTVVTVQCSQPLVFTAEVHAGVATAWSAY